jgi:outer membrane protein assembly factor BamB
VNRVAPWARTLGLGLLAFGALVGCSKKDKDVDPPAELVKFAATVEVQKAWSAGTGGAEPVLRLALSPAVSGETVYVAGHGGDVLAIAAATGKTLWRTDTRLELSAGPGVGAGLVVAGTADGDVVALDSTTGKQRWKVRVPGEVLAAPAIAESGVHLRAVDGRIYTLALADGKSVWNDEQGVPRLSLRGSAPPTLTTEALLVPYDNGKLLAYAPAQGDILWEASANPPSGKTELARLNDIDGPVVVDGKDVFVAGFQGRIAMLALDSGQVWWSRDFSASGGPAVDVDNVYATNAAGTVVALRRKDGAPVWEQSALAYRQVTPPVVSGDTVVVSDFEGAVHWLDAGTGALVGRASVGDRVRFAPVVAGKLVVVQDDKGTVTAFRTRPAR